MRAKPGVRGRVVGALFLHVDWHGAVEASCFLDGPVPPLVPFPQRIKGGIYISAPWSRRRLTRSRRPRGSCSSTRGCGAMRASSSRRSRAWVSIGGECGPSCSPTPTGTIPEEPQRLRAETGAKVYAGEGDAGVLRAGGPREAIFSAFSLPEGDLHPTTIDVALRGGESIAFGDVRFRALATPGHTPGEHLLSDGARRTCARCSRAM